jgi:hypothetical protein
MEELPKYKATPAFVGLGTIDPQPFVRGNSRYAPSGPQGSKIAVSEPLFNFGPSGGGEKFGGRGGPKGDKGDKGDTGEVNVEILEELQSQIDSILARLDAATITCTGSSVTLTI